jgi:hypothetical protein
VTKEIIFMNARFCLVMGLVLGAPVTAAAQEHATGSGAGAPIVAVAVPDQGPTGAPVEPDATTKPKDAPHFRFGMGLDGAVLVSPNVTGAAAGLQLRLGAQINQWFALYYQGHALMGAVVGGDASAGFVGAAFNTIMAELTLPILQIGFGPSLDVFGIAGCSATDLDCGSNSDVFFGLDGRIGVVIGGHGPGRHGGFAINANVHPTFVNGDVVTTVSLGLGGEMY